MIGGLNQRRGSVKEMIARNETTQVVTAETPLSEMFGYATSLRSSTQGRANYSMQFSHYAAVPDAIVAEMNK